MRSFFENVIKYLTWAANYFLLANIVLHLYKILIPENILTSFSGGLSLPMRLLTGLVIHFVFFLIITVVHWVKWVNNENHLYEYFKI